MKDSLWWQLLLVFGPLSLLTVGGGQSIIADIQQQTVSVHHWLTQDQFLDDFAIARASAGPNIVIVTLIGWQVAGLAGAMVTSLAIFLPSSILFYGCASLWRIHAFARWRDTLARGLAPVTVGLVLASAWSILATDSGGQLGWIVTGAAFLLLMLTRVNPVLLIAGGATIFLLLHG